MDFGIDVWPVLAATGMYFVLGALWYSNALFAAPWMAAQGIARADIDRSGLAASMVVTFLLELLAVIVLAAALRGMAGIDTWLQGATVGLVLGAGIGVVPMAVSAVYESRKPSLLWINGGYHVVAMTLAGAILAAW